MARIRIGLALGSGVARGWAHLGVLRALGKLGIEPDIIAGTSIGALVGGFYLGGHIETLEAWALRLTRLRMLRYFNLPLGGGMISGDKLFQEAEKYLGDIAVEDLDVPFVSVATDLRTGHEIWLREGRLVDAMRASLALPGIFRPMKLNGHWLIDGALVNPVPVSVCRALGAEMVIAVNLGADLIGKGYELNGNGNGNGNGNSGENGPAGNGRAGGKRSAAEFLSGMARPNRGEPSMFSVMVSSLNIVQDRISRARLASNPPDVGIAPRIGHIGLLEFHRAEELIAAGVEAVERSMPEIEDAIALFSTIHG